MLYALNNYFLFKCGIQRNELRIKEMSYELKK